MVGGKERPTSVHVSTFSVDFDSVQVLSAPQGLCGVAGAERGWHSTGSALLSTSNGGKS